MSLWISVLLSVPLFLILLTLFKKKIFFYWLEAWKFLKPMRVYEMSQRAEVGKKEKTECWGSTRA